jgi:hypothetical protein
MNRDFPQPRGDLASTAEEIGPVALQDHVHNGSRRRFRRAWIVTGAVTILVLAVVVPWQFGLFAFNTSAAKPAPVPSPVYLTAGPDFPGALYYRDRDSAGLEHDVIFSVISLKDGSVTRVLPGMDHNAGRAETVAFSPDGQWMAWLPLYTREATDRRDEEGDLFVARTDGSEVRILGHRFVVAGQLAWSPDSTRILALQSAPDGPQLKLEPDGEDWSKPARLVTVDVTTGATTTLISVGAALYSFAWSGDGHTIAYTDTRGPIYLLRAGGTPIRTVPGLIEVPTIHSAYPFWMAEQVWSLSPDATYIVVRRVYQYIHQEDEPAAIDTDVVLDTATGESIVLPEPGRLLQAYYTTDGKLLLRLIAGGRNTLTLLSEDGSVLARADEPAALAGLPLIGYVAR